MATLDALRMALVELDEKRTLELTHELLRNGVAPASILSSCQQALKVVGERYERQEYYIAGLIMAGRLGQEGPALRQPPHKEAEPYQLWQAILLLLEAATASGPYP